ncbi:tRNA lysidine(34) synthetase TilS [Halomonas profundus]|nr:tRNA lysidine(34) synthetase TilS [Halomonas profundus]
MLSIQGGDRHLMLGRNITRQLKRLITQSANA